MIEVHYVQPDKTTKVRHADTLQFSDITSNAKGLSAEHYIVRSSRNSLYVYHVDTHGEIKIFPPDQLDGAIMWARHQQ